MRTLSLIWVYFVFTILLSAQNNMVFETRQPPCGFESDSNAFENGLLSSSEGTQVIANDFLVAPGDSFIIDRIEVNFFTTPIITDADIVYYQDDNGLPGAVLNTMVDVTPTTVFYIGSFGLDIWKAIFDVPPFNFPGQAGVQTRYWISVTVSNENGDDEIYWETKSVEQQGFQPAVNDNGSGWELIDISGGQHVECVYTFEGECLLGMDNIVETAILLYPNPASSTIICMDCEAIVDARVYNLSGQIVRSYKDFLGEINVQNLPPGMYLVELAGPSLRRTISIIKE